MTTVRNVTCPFCSLLCDDLSVRAERGRLYVSDNACQLARRGFAAPLPPPEARLKGVPVPVEQAVTTASRLLKHSGKPLIAGLGIDVNGIRAALRLAEKTGAALLHTDERHAANNLKVLQTRGGIMTTLAEVKNRADTVIFVGDNVTGDYPRFIERFINNPYSLFTGKSKKLACLGRPGREELEQCNTHAPVVISDCGDDIADNLAILRAKLADNQLLDYTNLSGTDLDVRSTPAGGAPEPALEMSLIQGMAHIKNIPPAKNRKLNQVAAMIKAAEYGRFCLVAGCIARRPRRFDHRFTDGTGPGPEPQTNALPDCPSAAATAAYRFRM